MLPPLNCIKSRRLETSSPPSKHHLHNTSPLKSAHVIVPDDQCVTWFKDSRELPDNSEHEYETIEYGRRITGCGQRSCRRWNDRWCAAGRGVGSWYDAHDMLIDETAPMTFAEQATHVLLQYASSTTRCRHRTPCRTRVLTWPSFVTYYSVSSTIRSTQLWKSYLRTNMQICTPNCIKMFLYFQAT